MAMSGRTSVGHSSPGAGCGSTTSGPAGILAGAASVISNDTGPAHLGAALGRPRLTLFGDKDPNWPAARGSRAVALGALGARPCLDDAWDAWRGLATLPIRS